MTYSSKGESGGAGGGGVRKEGMKREKKGERAGGMEISYWFEGSNIFFQNLNSKTVLYRSPKNGLEPIK